jgi:hypothetical protein
MAPCIRVYPVAAPLIVCGLARAPSIKWAAVPSPQTHAIRSGGQHRRGQLGSPDEAAPHNPQLVQRCSVATALSISTDHAADGLTAWPQISEL